MAHPDGNLGFNPELESSLNHDTQGRIEAGLPESPDPKPFVEASYTPGMSASELAQNLTTQINVTKGIKLDAAQQQFESDKQVPVDPGPEFGTRQADRDNKAFEDLKAAKAKIEADSAKAAKFAKVLETAEADLVAAETTYAATVDRAVADRNQDFLEVASTAKGNSKEAAIQTKFVEDVHQANTEHTKVVEEVAKATKLLGIDENVSDDASLDAAVAQKTNSLKQSIELSQRVHGEGDASAVHYQEEMEAVQQAAQLLKKERDEHLIAQSSAKRGKAIDQAINQRLDALIELSQDSSRKGTRLAKARDIFDQTLSESSTTYHQSTYKVDEALSGLGVEATHRDVLRAAKNRDTSSVESGGPVTPPAATELDPLVAAIMNGSRDISSLTDAEKASYQAAVNALSDEQSAALTRALRVDAEEKLIAANPGLLFPADFWQTPHTLDSLTPKERVAVSRMMGDGTLTPQMRESLGMPPATPDLNLPTPPVPGAPELELPLPPLTLPEDNPDLAATTPTEPVMAPVPENVSVDEKKTGFSKSNLITKFASHLLPITSQENGATNRWDWLAYGIGALAVTGANAALIPFASTLVRGGMNAAIVGLNIAGKWSQNSAGRADDAEVKAGRMTSEQAAQRRLERISKHSLCTRVCKNAAKGAAAAAIVFGVVNLTELALSGAQAAVGAAPDVLSGATNIGESVTQFGQNVVESAGQLGSNAVEAIRQTGESISNYVADVIHHLVPDLDLPGGGGGGEVLHKATEGVRGTGNELVKAFKGIIKAVTDKGFWGSDISSVGNIPEWTDQAGGPSHEDMVRALIRGIWNSQHPGATLQPFNDALPLDQQVGYLDLSKLTQEQADTLRALLKTSSRQDYMNYVNNARGLFNQFVAVTK